MRSEHNKLVAELTAYKKECAKNGVLPRDFENWKEYFLNPTK